MKYLFVALLVAVSPWTDINRIATINKLKKEAKIAYNNGDYQKALNNYIYLTDSMNVEDENIALNKANAYWQLKDTTNAVTNYQNVIDSKDNTIRSVAQQQLGVIANRNKKHKEALSHFKEALKANPANDEARYNYELLKKLLKEQEKQDQENKDKKKDDKKEDEEQKQDQEKQDQQSEEEKKDQEQKKDGEGEEKEDKEKKEEETKEGDQKEDGERKEDDKKQDPKDGEESDEESKEKQDQMNSLSDKLEEIKMSEEKAQMILEALRNKEIQYYQQNKKKATKPRDSGKPDW